MRYTRARTDYVIRYHLDIDCYAPKLDAFRVQLLDECRFVTIQNMTADELWPDVMQELSRMRSSYMDALIMPLTDFQPFAYITLTDAETVANTVDLRMQMMLAGVHETPDERESKAELGMFDHMQRVTALLKAIDMIQTIPNRLLQ